MQNKFFSEKCAKAKSARIIIYYTFLISPLPSKFKYAKIFAKFLNKNVYSRKTKILKINL